MSLGSELPGGASGLADATYPSVQQLAGGKLADQQRGWPLGHYLAALLEPIRVADAVSLDPSLLLDPVRAPAVLLSTVEQATGTIVAPQLPEAVRRDRIIRHSAERFGRPAEIIAAVAETLTGMRRVLIRERYDPAHPEYDMFDSRARFHLTVITRTTETPSSAATAAAAQFAAPMRTLVHHVVADGITYDEANVAYDASTATYDSGTA